VGLYLFDRSPAEILEARIANEIIQPAQGFIFDELDQLLSRFEHGLSTTTERSERPAQPPIERPQKCPAAESAQPETSQLKVLVRIFSGG
jgi:hypothetical protein